MYSDSHVNYIYIDSYYNLAKALLLGDEEATADVVNHMPVPDGKHAKPVMDGT